MTRSVPPQQISIAMLISTGEETPVVIHGVHHVFHPPLRVARRRSRIVFITRGIARICAQQLIIRWIRRLTTEFPNLMALKRQTARLARTISAIMPAFKSSAGTQDPNSRVRNHRGNGGAFLLAIEQKQDAQT